jgi:hypothetical protein
MNRRFCLVSMSLWTVFTVAVVATVPVNVAGRWKFEVKAPVGSGEAVFTLSQHGEKVSGSYKGPLGETQVGGSVKSDAVVLSLTHEKAGKRMEETYEGTVEGKTITGTVTQQYMGGGTFRATRE